VAKKDSNLGKSIVDQEIVEPVKPKSRLTTFLQMNPIVSEKPKPTRKTARRNSDIEDQTPAKRPRIVSKPKTSKLTKSRKDDLDLFDEVFAFH